MRQKALHPQLIDAGQWKYRDRSVKTRLPRIQLQLYPSECRRDRLLAAQCVRFVHDDHQRCGRDCMQRLDGVSQRREI